VESDCGSVSVWGCWAYIKSRTTWKRPSQATPLRGKRPQEEQLSLFRHQIARDSAPIHRQHTLLCLLLLLFPLALLGCQGGPTQGSTKNELHAVVALSSNNVWAVGGMSTPKHFGYQVLIEHWDGAVWHTAMPDLAGELCAISAGSANDIWAVGGSSSCAGGGQLLTLHWDGQLWQQFSAPIDATSPQTDGALTAVAALSPVDVWAVGHTREQVLTLHWDGAHWQLVPQPFSGLSFGLQAIAALAGNDMWTVGFASDTKGNRFSLTEHWQGLTPRPHCAARQHCSALLDCGHWLLLAA
jgi:hypothetical protein